METLENITEQKRAEEELHKAQKLESLSAMAGGIAEDFNTLLSAILRNVFLAKISVPDEDKMLEEGLAIAEKGGASRQGAHPPAHHRGQRGLSRPESDGPWQIFSRKMAALFRRAERKGQLRRRRGSLAGGGGRRPDPASVATHRRECRGGHARRGSNRHPGGQRHRGGIGQAADPGRPIPQDLHPGSWQWNSGGTLSKIFDPYFTTKKSRRGLGLAVSYAIVRNHDGLIRVESREGQFSVFHILLPAEAASQVVIG